MNEPLKYFTEDAYNNLFRDISKNTKRYYEEDNSWLHEYFNNSNDYFKESFSTSIKEFSPFFIKGKKSDKQKAEEDRINARGIHKAFINITPYQASQKYFWAYLCHMESKYYEYVKDRWLQDYKETSIEITIEARFFVKTHCNLMNDNALSRLWWAAYLTYDPTNKENPYYLTDILMTNQTFSTDVLDTFNRLNFERIRGLLLGVDKFLKLEDVKGIGLQNTFRECKKYLNHDAAVRSYDMLSSEEIEEITFKYMLQGRDKLLAEKLDNSQNQLLYSGEVF